MNSSAPAPAPASDPLIETLSAMPPPPIVPTPQPPRAARTADLGTQHVGPADPGIPETGEPGALLRELPVPKARTLPAAWQGPTPVQERQRLRIRELGSELGKLTDDLSTRIATVQALVETITNTDGGTAEASRESFDLKAAAAFAKALESVLDKYTTLTPTEVV